MLKKYWKEILLIVFILIFLSPVLIYQMPSYYFSPDTQYVKAKTLRIAAGDLFADPVTGFPTFHPPYYHLLLSVFTRSGIDINILMTLAIIFNSTLLILLGYLILRECFGDRIAFYAAFLIPFIFQNLGPGQIFLSTAFYFSLSFYMLGLLLYLKRNGSVVTHILTAILWGVAFLISPVYFFLIAFTFGYELILRRNIRRFIIYSLVFLIITTPFIYQYLTVSRSSLAGTGAFAVWRGLPGGEWFKTFIIYLLSPVENKPVSWPVLPAVALLIFGTVGYCKSKKKIHFVIIAAVAYLFTAYNFNHHYSTRIEFFVALILSGYALKHLGHIFKNKKIFAVIIIAVVCLGLTAHLVRNIEIYANQARDMVEYEKISAGLKNNLGRFVKADDFVLASERTYRDFLLADFPVHGLLAYKTGEYFQLNSKIADEMRSDYLELMGADDISLIGHFCRKYNIKIALVSQGVEADFPAYRTIAANWDLVYSDQFFRIYANRPSDKI